MPLFQMLPLAWKMNGTGLLHINFAANNKRYIIWKL